MTESLKTWSKPAAVLAALAAMTSARPAHAWLFEEHAIIARQALTAPQAAALQTAWGTVRAKLAGRNLCDVVGSAATTQDEACVDLGTLVALAGDHSCSIQELEETLRIEGKKKSDDWLPDLLESAANTNRDIHGAKMVDDVLDAWRRANLSLNRIDDAYLTRASDNSAHFLPMQVNDGVLATPVERFNRYLTRATGANEKENALSMTLLYQIGAVSAAVRSRSAPTQEARDVWTMRALLAESFALHFLGDSFSAGHIAGTHGNKAERLGTHDFYCQHGLSSTLWSGTGYTAHGDAFMKTDDRNISSVAARESLQVFAEALSGTYAPAWVTDQTTTSSEYDVCKGKVTSTLAATLLTAQDDDRIRAILLMTAEPAMEDAEAPRFSNEIGLFLQLQGAARGSLSTFPAAEFNTQYSPRVGGAFELGAGFGFSLHAVTNQSADGDIYIQGSFMGTAKEQNIDGPQVAVSPRTGGGVRLRLPFYLIPGDTLLLSAFVLPVDSREYQQLMLRAAQGSKWWSFERIHFVHPFAWQIVVGREAAFYAFTATHEYKVAGPETIESREYTAYQLELPILEGRKLGSFSGELSADARAQFGVILDSAQIHSTAAYQGSDGRILDSVSAFLRFSFEGRYYVYRP